MPDTRPLPHLTCPVCGGPNACVPARCGDFDQPCWCEAISFSAGLLSRIGETGRKTSCICPACAAADYNDVKVRELYFVVPAEAGTQ